MNPTLSNKNGGFSLFELIVSMTVLLLVVATTLSALSFSTRMFNSQQMQADIHAGLRGTFELMTQEIGQAGSLGLTPKTLSAVVTGNTSVQTVTLNSTSGIFVGEKLTVDLGSSQETVQVTAILTSNRINGIFTKSHANGARVSAEGIFPQGVLSGSTATSLKLIGDMNADGSLTYVQYDCDAVAGTLSRSITTIAPGVTTRNTSQTLLTNLVANPGNTPCFSYGTAITAAGFTFVPSVGVSITLQTSKIDLQTKAFVTLTKSFSNLSPRNVSMGLTLAQASPAVTNRLQPTPPGVPLL